MDHFTLARLGGLRETREKFRSPTRRNSRSYTHHWMSTSKAEGRREDALVKQRDQMREEFERQKKNLINETEKARPSSNRFVGQHDSMEDTLKHSTVGLVHLEEFQQKRKELEEAKAREAARTNELKYVTISTTTLLRSGFVSRWLTVHGEFV